jgi:hypothetical protein
LKRGVENGLTAAVHFEPPVGTIDAWTIKFVAPHELPLRQATVEGTGEKNEEEEGFHFTGVLFWLASEYLHKTWKKYEQRRVFSQKRGRGRKRIECEGALIYKRGEGRGEGYVQTGKRLVRRRGVGGAFGCPNDARKGREEKRKGCALQSVE